MYRATKGLWIFLATVALVIGALAIKPKPQKTASPPVAVAERSPLVAPPGYMVRKLPGRRRPSIVPETLDALTLKAIAGVVQSRQAIRYVWFIDDDHLAVETGPPLDSRAMFCGNELTSWELERSDGGWAMRREASPIELVPPAVFLLPTRYSRPKTTPLRAKVVAGREQTFHFELLDD